MGLELDEKELAILGRLRDYFWYVVEQRNVIIVDIPEDTVVISFKVPVSLANKFTKWCREIGVTKSHVLRKIVEAIVSVIHQNDDEITIVLKPKELKTYSQNNIDVRVVRYG